MICLKTFFGDGLKFSAIIYNLALVRFLNFFQNFFLILIINKENSLSTFSFSYKIIKLVSILKSSEFMSTFIFVGTYKDRTNLFVHIRRSEFIYPD